MRDTIPRYAPDRVIIAAAMKRCPATGYRAYPPGSHPAGCPLVPTVTALEVRTDRGSRWYGCDRAYINSELRMVVIGFDARDEVRATWPAVPADRQ